MHANEATGEKEFTGRHMLVLLIAFFGVVFAVNIALAYFAESSWTGLVAENGYIASQEYNSFIAAEKRQEKLGWDARFSHDAIGLIFKVKDRSGSPVTGLDVVVTMGRPTHEGEDRVVRLAETGYGVYSLDMALPAGLWEASLVAKGRDGSEWRRNYRYVNSKAQ